MTMQALLRVVTGIVLLALLSACTSTAPRRNVSGHEALEKAAGELPESQLLDVWIELFDPGELPEKENRARGLTMEIREAEARYVPVHLRGVMEKTGYWGAVRVVPQGTQGAEVLVRGVIKASDGEVLTLEITALRVRPTNPGHIVVSAEDGAEILGADARGKFLSRGHVVLVF